jgi:DNA-binding beta-propeller fold protein YncE
VKVGNGSEGMAISPRGDLVVSVALRGSNGPQQSDKYNERGAIVVLARTGQTLTPVSTIEVGRVPEGVAFSPDGRYLYVANFYDDDVWVFHVEGTVLTDTGKRLQLPGHPASARVVTSGPRPG